MRVRFVESGGITGSVRGCDLHVTDLSPEDANELKDLVKAGGLKNSVQSYSPSSRDLREFEIEIDAGSRKTTVVYDTSTLPESVVPLVDFLQKRSKPMSP